MPTFTGVFSPVGWVLMKCSVGVNGTALTTIRKGNVRKHLKQFGKQCALIT